MKRGLAFFLFIASLVQIVGLSDLALAQSTARLAQDVTAQSPGQGEALALDTTQVFDPSGGSAVIESGTENEETLSYNGIDASANLLTGISRPQPTAHAAGSQIEPGSPSESPSPAEEEEASPSPSDEDSPTPDETITPEPDDDDQADESAQEEGPEPEGVDETEPSVCDPDGTGRTCSEFVHAVVVAIGGEVCEDLDDGLDACRDRLNFQVTASDPCEDGSGRDCEDVVEDLLAAIGGDPCSQPFSDACEQRLIDVLELSTTQGEDPCNARFGRSCVEVITDLIEIEITDPCDPNNTGRTCAELISDVLGSIVIGDPCDPNNTGRTCTDIIDNILDGITIGDPCDPNNTGRSCDDIVTDLLGQAIGNIGDLCDPNNTGDACDDYILDIVNNLKNDTLYDLCGSTNQTTCVNNLADRIQDLLTTACGGSSSSGITNCTNKVMTTVNSVLTTVCQSTNASTCANNLITKINTLLVNACGGSIGMSASAAAHPCVDEALEVVNFVLLTACQSTNASTCADNLITKVNQLLTTACGGWDSSGVTNCTNKVMTTVNSVLITVCQSSNTSTCTNNLITKVNQLLTSVCGGTSTSGATNCSNKVLTTVNSVLTTACQTTDPVTCVNNLITKVNNLLISVCTGSVTMSSSELGTPAEPWLMTTTAADISHPCVEEVLDVVDLVLMTVCQSTDAGTCANNVITKVNQLLTSVCGGTSTSGATNCTNKVLATVNSVLTTACQTTDPVGCVNNLITKVNNLLITACTGNITMSSSELGTASDSSLTTTAADISHPCVDKVVDVVNLVLTTTCQTTDPVTCVNNLITKVNNLLITVCTGNIMTSATETGAVSDSSLTTTSADISHPCVDKVIEVVHLVLMTACQSTDAATCANNLITRVNNLLITACTGSITMSSSELGTASDSSLTTTSADISHPCVDKAVQVVNFVLTTACQSTDAATCASNLITKVNNLLISVCTGGITMSASESGTVAEPPLATTSAAEPDHACIDTVVGVVNLALTTACQSTDAATCANNLITKVNSILISVCTGGSINMSSSETGTVADPSVTTTSAAELDHACIDTVVGVVNFVLTTACQSTDAATCANNLISKVNDALVAVCTGTIMTTSTDGGGISGPSLTTTSAAEPDHACIDKVSAVVATILTTACGSSDLATCEANLIHLVQELIETVCPGGLPACTQDEQDAVMAIAQQVLDQVANPLCPGGFYLDDCERAIVDLINAVVGDITNLCPETSDCVNVIMALVQALANDLIYSVCPSELDCASTVGNVVNQVLATFCATAGCDPATIGPAGASVLAFEVSPRQIFPGVSGRPQQVNIYTHVEGTGWSINIANELGATVKTFAGLTGATRLIWDGRSALGSPLPNGQYKVTLTAATEDGAFDESAWVTLGDGPLISSLIPSQLQIGQEFTINGAGFGVQGNGFFGVSFDDEPADVLSWSPTQIRAVVPTSLEPGTHEVTVSAGDLLSASFPIQIAKYTIPLGNILTGRIYIRVKPGASALSIANAHGDATATQVFPGVAESYLLRWYEIPVLPGLEAQKAQNYAQDANVEWAVVEPVMDIDATKPNDPRFPNQWHLDQTSDVDIDAPEAWDLSKGDASITVGVIDSGVANHNDLDAHKVSQVDTTNTNLNDGCGHGTSVAGIAAAVTNNGVGVSGSGWKTRFRSYKVFNGNCNYTGKPLARVIEMASSQNQIINMSLGCLRCPDAMARDAVKAAWARGDIIIASAGNEGSNAPHHPSDYDHVVSVGWLNPDGSKNVESNYGNKVDVWAPGEAILTTHKNGGYDPGFRGTSAAAPVVAGIAGLLKAARPGADNGKIVAALKSAARNERNNRVSAYGSILDLIRLQQPNGTFVREATKGRVWFIDNGVKRLVRSALILESWGIASSTGAQIAVLDDELLESIGTGEPLGFRPGTLISTSTTLDPIYAITNNSGGGTSWIKPTKRLIPAESFNCLGYSQDDVMVVSDREARHHSTGTAISGCDNHPDGAVLQTLDTTTGELIEWMVDGANKRRIPDDRILDAWGFTEDVIPPSATSEIELSALAEGADIGFRPGRLIKTPNMTIWLITSSGGDFARSVRRDFANRTAMGCFGFDRFTTMAATSALAGLHATGSKLNCGT